MRKLFPSLMLIIILAACTAQQPVAVIPTAVPPAATQPVPTRAISPTKTPSRNCRASDPCDLTPEELASLKGKIVLVRGLDGGENELSIELIHLPDLAPVPLVKVKNLANVAVSPSGERIAYSVLDDLTKKDVEPAIYVINTDGSRHGPLYVPYYPHTYAPYTYFAYGSYGIPGMSWSPDERKIAFACVDDLSSNAPKTGICVYFLDDMSLKMIYKAENPYRVLMPIWSPDGGKIAFVENLNPPSKPAKLAYFSINSDGSGRTDLMKNLLVGIDQKSVPGWSSDGKALTFLTDFTKPNNQRELVRVNVDGNVLERKAWKGDAKIAAFSPDGNWLITYAGSNISDLPVAITSVDGTKTHRIAKGIDGVLWSR